MPNESILFVFDRAQKQIHGKRKENVAVNNLIKLMAISRTPALFARVDLFSRSRVIICYLREIIISCRRKRHWK